MTYGEFLLQILDSSTDVVTAAYNTGFEAVGVGFCYSDKSDGYFDGLDNFTLIVTVLSMILIGPPLFIYSVIRHHKRRG